jgi:hypothetical protein
LSQGVELSALPGGREAFDAAHAEVAVLAQVLQQRFAAALDRIGPPGAASWDPHAAQIALRKRTFSAQQLGSFDGESWLWSWANPHLALPEDKTTVARALRDRAAELRIPALSESMLLAADEQLPYMLGDLAIGHGLGEAYYLANQSQVYVVAPGQLPRGKRPAVDELREALDAVARAFPAHDLARGLAFAADRLGVPTERTPRALVARDGKDEVGVPLAPDGLPLRALALVFTTKQLGLGDVVAHLRGGDTAGLPVRAVDDACLEIEGAGFFVRVRRSDKLRDVMREAERARQDDAKRYGAVLVVEAGLTPSYEGTRYGVVGGFDRAWAPADELESENDDPPVGPFMAAEALAVCERLNTLRTALAYDLLLRSRYPSAR